MDEIERMARIIFRTRFPEPFKFETLYSSNREDYMKLARDLDAAGYVITQKVTAHDDRRS